MLLVPPVNLLPLAVGGLALARWRPRVGWGAVSAAVLLTWMFSSGLVATLLVRGLEDGLYPTPDLKPQAIVILAAEANQGLSGGLVSGLDVGTLTLERLRAGARLARQTQLPVLMSGGEVIAGRPSLAELMQTSFQRDFGMETAWTENVSGDTWENAFESAKILAAHDVSTVYVVSHGWHLRRALIAFRQAGIVAVPAPVRLQPPATVDFGDLIPSPRAWLLSYWAVHEWLGCLAYALRAAAT